MVMKQGEMMKSVAIGMIMMLATAVWGAERPPVPGAPVLDSGQKAILKSCKVPEWLIILPPPVEKDYADCVNRFYQPSNELAITRLKLHVDKKAELVSLKPAAGFLRAYEIEYSVEGKKKSLLCNEDLSYCVANEPVFQKK